MLGTALFLHELSHFILTINLANWYYLLPTLQVGKLKLTEVRYGTLRNIISKW